MDEDLAIILQVLLEVDETRARSLMDKLGKQMAEWSKRAAADGRKQGGDIGKGVGEGMSKGVESAIKHLNKMIDDALRLQFEKAQKAQANHYKQMDRDAEHAARRRTERERKQGVDDSNAQRAKLSRDNNDRQAALKTRERIDRQAGQKSIETQRLTLDKERSDHRTHNTRMLGEHRLGNNKLLQDQQRYHAVAVARAQQHAVRRTVLIRTMWNNITRINQTFMTAGLTAWRSYFQRRLASQTAADRQAEIRLQASMQRQTAATRTGLQAQTAMYQMELTKRAAAMQGLQAASTGGVVGALRGQGPGGMALRAGTGIGGFMFLRELLGGGYRRLIGLENAQKKLDQMGVSAENSLFLSERLLDTLSGTPYALDEGSSALAAFVSAGADLQDIPKYLDMITDAAAFGGANFNEVAGVFRRIFLQGKVEAQELNMLSDRDIPAIQVLSAGLGISTEEFMATRRGAGKGLSADEFFEAWEKGSKSFSENGISMAGAARGLGDTTVGALANMRTALARLGAELLKPIFGSFQTGALRVTAILNGITSIVKGLTGASGDGPLRMLGQALGWVARALAAFVAARGAVQVLGIIAKTLALIASAPVAVGLLTAAGAIGLLYERIEPLNSAVRAGTGYLWRFTTSLVSGSKEWFLVGYRANEIIDKLSTIVRIQSSLGFFARQFLDFSKALWDGTREWYLVGWRIEGVIDSLSNIVLLQTSIGHAARVIWSALGDIGKAIANLAITRDFSAFREAIERIVEGMRTAWRPTADLLREQLELGMAEARRYLLRALPQLGQWISQNLDKVIPAGGALGAGLLVRMLGVGGGTGMLLRLGIGGLISAALIQAITAFDTAPAEAALGERLSTIWTNAIAWAAGIREGGADLFTGLFTIKNVDSEAGRLGRQIRTVVTAAIERGGGVVKIITNFFGRLGDTIFSSMNAELIAKWAIDLPRKFGKALSLIAFSEEFLKLVGGLAAVAGATAGTVALQFARGFIEGFWERRGDIATVFRDALSLIPVPDIARSFAAKFAAGVAVALAAKATLARIFGPLAAAGQRFAIGFAAPGAAAAANAAGGGQAGIDPYSAARTSLAKLGDEATKSGSKMADLGIKAQGAVDKARDGFLSAAVGVDKLGVRVEANGQLVRTHGGRMQGAAGLLTRAWGDASTRVGRHMQRMGDGMVSFGALVERGTERAKSAWQKMGGAMGALSRSALITTSAISGYFIGMSDDIGGATVSIAGALTSIAFAFQAGPWVGAAATAATVLGIFWGRQQKEAQATKEATERQVAEMEELQGRMSRVFLRSFEGADSSGSGARRLAMLDQFRELGPELATITTDFEKFGISTRDVVEAATGDATDLADLWDQSITDVMRSFETGTGDMQVWGKEWREAVKDFNFIDLFGSNGHLEVGSAAAKNERAIRSLIEAAQQAPPSDWGQWRSDLIELGVDVEKVDSIMGGMLESFNTALEGEEGSKFLLAASEGIRAAIASYEALQEREIIARAVLEQEMTATDRFSASWDRLKGAIDRVRTAYNTYLDALYGREVSRDETIIATYRAIESRFSLDTSEMPDVLAEAEVGAAERDILSALGPEVSRIIEAAPSRSAGRSQVREFLDEIIQGIEDPTQKAEVARIIGENLDEIFDHAWEARGTIETMAALSERIRDLLGPAGDFQINLDEAPDFQSKKAMILRGLRDIYDSSPEVRAFIDEEGWDASVAVVMRDILGITEGEYRVDVLFQAIFTPSFTNAINAITGAAGRALLHGLNPEANYDGGYIPGLTLSTLGERGPEAVFPLTNPRRMREIMGIPQVAAAFDTAGLPAAQSNSSSVATTNNSVTNNFNQEFKIESSEPRAVGSEVVRKTRTSGFLGGAYFPGRSR